MAFIHVTPPVASGWSILPGGAFTHWKAPPFHGAPRKRSPVVGSRTGAPSGVTRHVSSPRHSERSVRSYRTALSCVVHIKGYETRRHGASYADPDARDSH
jgi:hypothetical protein